MMDINEKEQNIYASTSMAQVDPKYCLQCHAHFNVGDMVDYQIVLCQKLQ